MRIPPDLYIFTECLRPLSRKEKKKDINRLSEAYYCQGRILSELSASEEALTAYLKAKELVRETSDRDLEALSIII